MRHASSAVILDAAGNRWSAPNCTIEEALATANLWRAQGTDCWVDKLGRAYPYRPLGCSLDELAGLETPEQAGKR